MGASITLTDGHAPVTIDGTALSRHRLHHAGSQRAGQDVRPACGTADEWHHDRCANPYAPAITANSHCVPSAQKLTRSIDSISITGPQTPDRHRSHRPRRHLFGRVLPLRRGALSRNPDLSLDGLGLNPTRAALLDVLTALGARIAVLNLEEKHC